MLNFESGTPVAFCDNDIIYLDKQEKHKKEEYSDNSEDSDNSELEQFERIETGCDLKPLLDINQRSVSYIAGPSGSGKSTHAVNLIKNYLKVYPNKPFYLFSRTDYKTDPVFKGMKVNQIVVDKSLIEDPIDITQELTGGSIVLFDDCNTIQDDKVKKAVDKLICDILEVGRKLDITIVITNHLVIPNEKKIARTILNEMQNITVFPKSGSVQQIGYVLKQYLGLSKKQIEDITKLDSRWITIHKNYPMYVVYAHGVYLL
jgi:Cdc6-like AAA superfamily ATPase